jgi:oligosaccharide repeat unit polymerase
MPNRNKSILFEALAASASAFFLLLWQAVSLSPAGVLLLGLLALSYVNYVIGRRDVLYPAFTFTAIWTAVTTAYLACPIEIRPLGWKTTAILLGGTTFFSIGSLIGNRPFYLAGSQNQKNEDRDNPQGRFALLAYTLFALPWIVFEARNLAGGSLSLSPESLIQLRLVIVSMALRGEGAYSNRFIDGAFMIGSYTFLVFLLEEKRKWAKLLCASYVIVFFLATTARDVLMQALCWWLCVGLLRRPDRRFFTTVKWLSAAGLGIIILMTSLTFLTKARTEGGGATQEAANMTLSYVAGPMAAFDYAVYHPGPFENEPAAIFAGARTRLAGLNIIRSTPLKALDDYVFVPFGMNVYTCFKPYYEEFGVLGCLLAFGVIGLIEGKVFFGAINDNRVAKFFFAYLSFPLMFSAYDDRYATYNSDVLYLYTFVFAVGYFFLMKRFSIRLFRSRSYTPATPFMATQE